MCDSKSNNEIIKRIEENVCASIDAGSESCKETIDCDFAQRVHKHSIEHQKEINKLQIAAKQFQHDKEVAEKNSENSITLEEKKRQINVEIEETKKMFERALHKYNKHQVIKNFTKATKTLMCTHFDYQASDVTGYILNRSKNKLLKFNFNQSQIKSVDITKELWTCIEAAADEDWSDVFDEEEMEVD